jgi:hypothetical protein
LDLEIFDFNPSNQCNLMFPFCENVFVPNWLQATKFSYIKQYSNLDLWNITLRCGFQFQHTDSRAFKPKALLMTVDAPWYVTNAVMRKDFQIPTVKEKTRCYSSQHSARLSAHPNDLTVNLMELPDNRWLRRHLPNDLATRFLV